MFYNPYHLPDHFELNREGQFNFLIKTSVTGLSLLSSSLFETVWKEKKEEMVNIKGDANVKHKLFALFWLFLEI